MTDVELAEYLRLAVDELHVLRRRHVWPCVRLGRFHFRFTEEQVQQIITEHTVAPESTVDLTAVAVWGQTPLSAARSRR